MKNTQTIKNDEYRKTIVKNLKKIQTTIILVSVISFASAQVATTLAGSDLGGWGVTDGIGNAALFHSPLGVAADGNGNLYVADYDNNKIRKIIIATATVTTFAGGFYKPSGVALDGNGNIYVSDTYNNEIRKIVIATGIVTIIAGQTTSGSADGTGTAASFNNPYALATDGSGNVYVCDFNNNKIRKIVIATGVVTTLAGNNTAGSTNGTGTSASFKGPNGIATDGNGNLYVADLLNHEIRKIVIATGVVTTLAGTTTAGSADGTGAAASFNSPTGVTADGNGNLYVTDRYIYKIRKIVIATGAVTTISGVCLSGTTDGPKGIAVDGSSGNIYFSDDQVIREITSPNGIAQYSISNIQFSIYPNPTTDHLTVELLANISKTEIKIFNMLGELEYSATETKQKADLDVSGLTSGLHIIQISTRDKISRQKFIKK